MMVLILITKSKNNFYSQDNKVQLMQIRNVSTKLIIISFIAWINYSSAWLKQLKLITFETKF